MTITMAKAATARRSTKQTLTLVTNDGKKKKQSKLVHNSRVLEKHKEAQLEFEQNKRIFTTLEARNENQAIYISHLNSSRLIFAIGCPGTGKTLVSTLWACQQLERNLIDRIIVTRPMVGCDEDIGFLPGTEEEKYLGWVGPVMEILEGYFGKKQVVTYIKYGKVVLKPLMMMRGSTFRNAVVILDEAQNTTPGQMKMFLTRVGEKTKLVINGDLEQTDLPGKQLNGLQDAVNKFRNSKLVKLVEFTEDDVVRDSLVREIIKVYRN